MKKFLKVLVIVACAVALVAGSVAATVAYLTMKTDSIENTFTAGNIKIELTQDTTLDTSKMVPGQAYTVDAKVTVKANSESCWLFIKIEQPDNFDTFMNYAIADGWTLLEEGVYYREVAAAAADAPFNVIKDNTITADPTCTKEQYNELNGASLTLSLTAYAVQRVNFNTAAEAWTEAKKLG